MNTGHRHLSTAGLSLVLAAHAAMADLAEPTNFEVAMDDLVNQYAVLSWAYDEAVAKTIVYRSYGEGGPWTPVAEVSEASTWTDTGAPLGVPCYYRIATADGSGTAGDMSHACVSHRRCSLLEREWSDMTHLKNGVVAIWNTTGVRWSSGTVGMPTSDEAAATCAFDDDAGTFPNMGYKPKDSRLAVGVDLGEAYGIGFVRALPRNHTQGITNFKGLVFYGSNSDAAWYGNAEPALTEPTESGAYSWYILSTTNATPYRYVYASNPNVNGWNNMVAEIQFYGWPAAALAGYPVGATGLKVVQSGSSATLSWNANGAASVFAIERKTGDGAWTRLASGLTATDYVDGTVVDDGTEYVYRVVTVNGESVAYSAVVGQADVTGLTATQPGAAVSLSWNASDAASVFAVERKAGDGVWVRLASGLTTKTFVDDTVSCDGTAYAYRVATDRNGTTMYSAETVIIPYGHGNGKGLHTVFRFPYVSTAAGDSVAAVATNAVFIAAAATEEARSLIDGVEGAHTNVFVTWTGKLIVPFAGNYTFYATADDAVSVYIDGANVLCKPSIAVNADEMASPVQTLAVGEHDILVQYWQGDGASGCALSWEGPVTKEVIPASQFVPVPAAAIPAPWEGARTFTREASSLLPGNVRVNSDRSFDFSFHGDDIYFKSSGYLYMWQRCKGNFSFDVKVTHIGERMNGMKGGVMVCGSLDAAAPFESIFMRKNDWGITCKRRNANNTNINDQQTIAGDTAWTVKAEPTVWLRISRYGNVFTSSYRTGTTQWTELYRYEDTNGIYGETVYVGPVVTYSKPATADWGTAKANPYYSWRFSNMRVNTFSGLRIFVR